MSIEFNTNFEKIKLNKLYNDVIENNSTYNYNNQNNVTTNYNVDSSTNFSNSTNNDIETIDMTASTDDNISNNLNEVDQENYKDEVSIYVDNLIANVDQFTDEQKKRLYQAKSIDEANEIIIDIYTEIFGEMYGFSREEVIKLLTGSATIEEIFDENFEVHIEAFMSFLTKSGLSLNSDEKKLIRSSKSWVNATKIANDIEIKQKRILLQSYGFNETDINRIINGEITIDELYNEIMAEDDHTRRYNLALVQIFNVLINSEDESLTRFRDLSINFNTFEEMQEYTNNLINKREQIINNFFSNEVVSVSKCACFFDDYILQRPGAYMYADADDVGNAVDNQAKCTVLYYTYIDSNGLLQFAWDNPAVLDNGYNLDPDEEVTIKKVSYYDVFGNTEYYRLLRSYVVNDDMDSLSDEVDHYWERNENQPVVEGIEEQLKENETNIEYLQQMRSYIIEETKRYTFSELEYTRHSDFEINCHYSTDIIKYDISDGNKTLINFEDILIEYKNRDITLSVKDATLIYLYMCVFSGQEVDGDVEKYIDELSDQDRYFAEDFIEYEWYRFLSNEEKRVFYYICNTEGYEAGFDYLKGLDSYLDEARYNEKVSKAQEEANFGYACLGIVWGIFEGLDNLFYSIDSTISGRKMRLSETFCSSDVWRSQFIIDISNDWGTGWGLGFNVFFTVLDMTPTLVAAYFTAGSSLVLQSTIQTLTIATTMGVKSYSSTLNMALELGLSDSSAILLALSTAAVEILMEKWSFGHLIGIKESLSATTINSIKTLASKIVKPEWVARVTNIICISASLLKQGFIEADEEICTFFADNFLEQLIAGKLSNYNQQIDYYIGCGYSEEEAVSLVSKASKKELFDTFVVSFMSGILSGGISYKLSEKSYIKTINKLSDNIIDIYSGNKTNSVVEYRQEIRSLLKDGNYIGIIDKIMSTQGVSIEQKKTIASEVVKIINKYIELDTSMQTKLNEKINNSIDLTNIVFSDELCSSAPFFGRNSDYNSIFTYNYQNEYNNVVNSVILCRNAYAGVIDAISNAMASKDIMLMRKTCRAAINFLINKVGLTSRGAAEFVGNCYLNIINKNGFNSYYDSDTKITYNESIALDKFLQTATIQKVQYYLKMLPPEFTKNIKVVNIYNTFNPYDFMWEIDYNIEDFTSAATGGNGEINIWVPSGKKIRQGDISFETIIHETAHNYDETFCSQLRVRLSKSFVWLNAMSADQNINGLIGCTNYARESASSLEDFAEAVMLYYSNPTALDAFPNRKSVLEMYLPKQNNILNDYDYNINNKYKKIEKAFNFAFSALINKYGSEQALTNIQSYIDTGDLFYITSSEGARTALSQFSIEEVRKYLKTINNNSLDIKKLIGG